MFAKKSEMKKIDRLKKRSDFLWVQKNGRKWIAKGLIVEIAENSDRGDSIGLRFGLTVSKRVSKLAVLRNRTKRRLRAICLEALPDYAHHNLDVVVIGRVSSQERTIEELRNDLVWCLKKMNISKMNIEKLGVKP